MQLALASVCVWLLACLIGWTTANCPSRTYVIYGHDRRWDTPCHGKTNGASCDGWMETQLSSRGSGTCHSTVCCGVSDHTLHSPNSAPYSANSVSTSSSLHSPMWSAQQPPTPLTSQSTLNHGHLNQHHTMMAPYYAQAQAQQNPYVSANAAADQQQAAMQQYYAQQLQAHGHHHPNSASTLSSTGSGFSHLHSSSSGSSFQGGLNALGGLNTAASSGSMYSQTSGVIPVFQQTGQHPTHIQSAPADRTHHLTPINVAAANAAPHHTTIQSAPVYGVLNPRLINGKEPDSPVVPHQGWSHDPQGGRRRRR